MALSKEELKVFYDECRGEKEALDKAELETLAQRLGYNPTADELVEFMESLDSNCDGKVSFDEFCNFMASQPADPDEELRSAFNHFDKNGDGLMDKGELKAMLEEIDGDVNDVDELFEKINVNPDGKFEYEEFIKVVNAH